jgi:hypothetical protein
LSQKERKRASLFDVNQGVDRDKEAQSSSVNNIDEVAQGGSDDRVRHFRRHGDLHNWFCVAVAHRESEKEKRSELEKGD